MGNLLYGGAIHIREQAKIDAARITQKPGNERRAKEAELQRFNQTLGNKKLLEAAGNNIGTVTENTARALDAATMGSFSQRIAAAEELGASSAMAAAAGLGGSSVEAYNETLRLSHAMQEEQADRQVRSQVIAAGQERGQILTDAVASMDRSVYSANIDYTKYVDHKKQSGLGSLISVGLGAVVGAFAGPQAGLAVAQAGMGFSDASAAANSGNFDQASSSLMGGITSAVSSVGRSRTAGEKVWGSARSKAASVKIPDVSGLTRTYDSPFDVPLISRPSYGGFNIM